MPDCPICRTRIINIQRVFNSMQTAAPVPTAAGAPALAVALEADMRVLPGQRRLVSQAPPEPPGRRDRDIALALLRQEQDAQQIAALQRQLQEHERRQAEQQAKAEAEAKAKREAEAEAKAKREAEAEKQASGFFRGQAWGVYTALNLSVHGGKVTGSLDNENQHCKVTGTFYFSRDTWFPGWTLKLSAENREGTWPLLLTADTERRDANGWRVHEAEAVPGKTWSGTVHSYCSCKCNFTKG
jgi:hypothetical protein